MKNFFIALGAIFVASGSAVVVAVQIALPCFVVWAVYRLVIHFT